MLLSDYGQTILIASLVVLSAIGWGAIVTRRRFDAELIEYVVVRFTIGLAVIYFFCFALSIARCMTRIPVTIVLICGVGLSVLELERLWTKLRSTVHQIGTWPLGDRVLIGAILVLTMLQLVCSLTPLFFYDAVVYHAAAPAEFFRQGTLAHIPWNVFTDSPLAIQLTVGTSLVLDDGGAAFKFLLALLGVLMAPAAAILVQDRGRRVALWSALFVLAYPEFWVQQSLGVVDLGAAAFVLLGMAWFLRGWVIPAGVAFGFAVGSRYQNGLVIALAFFFIVLFRSERRTLLRDLAVVSLILFVVVAPWLVRNFIGTGNPIFPFLFTSLGGVDWSVEQTRLLRLDQGPTFSEASLLQKIAAPVGTLLLTPSNGLFGVLLLFGAIAAFRNAALAKTRIYAAIGLAGIVFWGVVRPSLGAGIIRYSAGSILFLLAVLAVVLSNWNRLCAILTIGSLALVYPHLNGIVPVSRILLSPSSRTDYWRAQNTAWEAFDFINGELNSSKHRVLLIGETRRFWIKIPQLSPGPYNGSQLEKIFDGKGPAWSEHLRALGVTHIFIHRDEWQRLNQRYQYFHLTEDQGRELAEWLGRQRIVFDDSRGHIVFEIIS